MLDIQKTLTLSTAHISENTCEKLNMKNEINKMGLCVYKKGDFGYFIYILKEKTYDNENIPEDLQTLLQFTVDMDCDILCLDRDGDILPYLETYDW